MPFANHSEILNSIVPEFIKTTNELIDIYEKFPSECTLEDDFSIVLMRIYQQFMLDIFPSVQLLIDHKRFVSFAILCRSVLDLIIQLTWILNLDEVKKSKAIKCFIEFEGIYLTEKGKQQYEWQYLIDEKYSLRNAAIEVGIDQEILNLPVNKVYQKSIASESTAETNGMELKLTVFDYLSKITHWNPRFLKELIGVNKDKHLGYTSEYLRMCIIALPTFISCAIIFAEIFCGHFFEDKNDELKNLRKTKTSFEKLFIDLINNSETDTTTVT